MTITDHCKLFILGDSKVGKTATLFNYFHELPTRQQLSSKTSPRHHRTQSGSPSLTHDWKIGSLSRTNSQNEKYNSSNNNNNTANNNNNNSSNDNTKKRKTRRPYSLFVDKKSINTYHRTNSNNTNHNNMTNNSSNDNQSSPFLNKSKNLDLNIYKHSNSTTNLLSPILNHQQHSQQTQTQIQPQSNSPVLKTYSPLLNNHSPMLPSSPSFNQTQFLHNQDDNNTNINNHYISPLIEPAATFLNDYSYNSNHYNHYTQNNIYNYNTNYHNTIDDSTDLVINTIPTIGVNIKKKVVNIDNRLFDCLFCDSAGKSEYQNSKMMQQLINNCHGIIIMYDITDYTSFVHCLNGWLDKFIGLPHKRVYLVGNKNDLSNERQVNKDDVKKLVKLAKEQFDIDVVNSFEINCYNFELVNDTMNNIIMDLVVSNCYDQDLKLTNDINGNSYYNDEDDDEDEKYFTALEYNPLQE